MSSIAAKRVNTRVCQLQPNGMFSRGTHAYPGANGVQPARRQATGPAPKPRWRPLPQLLYAQVVKTVRRRRLVRVQHRVVFGTLQAVHAVLAPLGCQINTAFIEVRPVGRKEAEASG